MGILSIFTLWLAVSAGADDSCDTLYYEKLAATMRHPKVNTENSSAQMMDSTAAIFEKTNPVRKAGLAGLAEKIGDRVYISEKLPSVWTTAKGEKIPVDGFVAVYASVKKALITHYGLGAEDADVFGLYAMKASVEASGQSWQKYKEFLAQAGFRMQPKSTELVQAANNIMKQVNVSRDYDIPYLAGYAVDNPRQIYLNRGLPNYETMPDGRQMPITLPLVVHESVEKALIDELHLPGNQYERTHQIAQHLEKATLEALGFQWYPYQHQTMDRLIDSAYTATLTAVPANLDLTPYQNEHDDELIERMKKVAK